MLLKPKTSSLEVSSCRKYSILCRKILEYRSEITWGDRRHITVYQKVHQNSNGQNASEFFSPTCHFNSSCKWKKVEPDIFGKHDFFLFFLTFKEALDNFSLIPYFCFYTIRSVYLFNDCMLNLSCNFSLVTKIF